LYSSCGKKELGVNLLGNLKNENPYKGDEKLIFLNQNDDSIVFYGEGRFSEVYEYTNSTMNGYYLNETDHCYFRSADNQYKLDVRLSSHLATNDGIVILLATYNKNELDSCNAYTTEMLLPLLDYIIESSFFYIDTLETRKADYYNVFVDSSALNQWNGCTQLTYAKRFFYSTQSGLIKIDFSDGSFWELESIEWAERD